MNPKENRKKLHKMLMDKGLFSQDFETFEKGYNTPELQHKLYNGMKDEKVSGSYDYVRFQKTFFSDMGTVGPTISDADRPVVQKKKRSYYRRFRNFCGRICARVGSFISYDYDYEVEE